MMVSTVSVSAAWLEQSGRIGQSAVAMREKNFPSTTLFKNLVFLSRFRTNLRSKLPISYSTSKKLPTRRSISSVGSGAERTAMCAGHSAPSTHPHTILGDWTTYQKIFQILTVFTSPGVQKTLPIARNGVLYLGKGFSARRLELKTLSCPCISQVPCCTCVLEINFYLFSGVENQVTYL